LNGRENRLDSSSLLRAIGWGCCRGRRWRRYINQRLEGDYADLFTLLDLRILLRPPDFATVYSWRAQQEAGLSRTGQSLSPMTDRELRRFIAHYERLTRWILLDEPANVIVHLDSRRVPIQYCLKDCSGARGPG
jgi:D-glycerate 3-kinase